MTRETTQALSVLIANLHIAPVSQHDSIALFEWRNNAHTRSMSLNTDLLTFDAHNQWFESVLHDPSQYFYLASIAENINPREQDKAGVIRFDIMPLDPFTSHSQGDPLDPMAPQFAPLSQPCDEEQASIRNSPKIALASINLNPDFRAKGLSTHILRKAIDNFTNAAKDTASPAAGVSHIKAIIKANNIASIKCFEGAGFSKEIIEQSTRFSRSTQSTQSTDSTQLQDSQNLIYWLPINT